MRISTFVTLLAIPLALAACDSSNENAAETADMPMAENMPVEDMPMQNGMPMMEPGEQGQTASAEGSVTAVDEVAGTITINHGPVTAVNWPAMTMAFQADEVARRSVAVGDKVAFEFRTIDGGAEIVSISRK